MSKVTGCQSHPGFRLTWLLCGDNGYPVGAYMNGIKSREKIGRNDPCWCGSGKKYKKCHLHREHEEPIQPWQIDKEHKRALEQGHCLAPNPWKHECSSQISRAHTVPRASLARIARDGHVYALKHSFQDLLRAGGLIKPKLVGINQASTFTGFCSEHDRSIFAPVENLTFTATLEQCFLLSYRATVREIFIKQAKASLLGLYQIMDRGMPIIEQRIVQNHVAVLKSAYSITGADSQALKSIYDDVLVARSFHRVRAYVIELREAPSVMCSGGFYPEQDFEGHGMQDLLDLKRLPHLLTVTSFQGGDQAAIVMSWIDTDDSVCLPFVKSLHRIGDDSLTDALVTLFFTHFGNVHIQPEWWEALSETCRQTLIERFNLFVHPSVPRAPGFLKDDGLRFNPWPVGERRSVNFEI